MHESILYGSTSFAEMPLPRFIPEFEADLLSALILISHGYDSSKPGYTAGGFVDFQGHVVTAHHNVSDGYGTVINPSFPNSMRSFEFEKIGPDAAQSRQRSEDITSRIRIGVPNEGDFQLAFWLRHIGGGKFRPFHMWGENIGQVSLDKMTLWKFCRNGKVPELGDSGALILSLGPNANAVEPIAVGTLRRTMPGDNNICVFSALDFH